MKTRSLVIVLAAGAFVAAPLILGSLRLATAKDPAVRVGEIEEAFSHAIPNATGKTLTGLVVSYGPGGLSAPHRHGSAFVVGYVLSGAIRSQVDGGQVKVFHAGESWTEAPGAHHNVSENASKTEPASLLALFVADSGTTDLVTFDKAE